MSAPAKNQISVPQGSGVHGKVREAKSLDPTHLAGGGLVFASGSGCLLRTVDGTEYFDATGGSGAVNLGHQHPAVVQAVVEQAMRLSLVGWNLQTEPRRELVRALGALAPYNPCSVLFGVTGSEAIEAALKVARAYTGRDKMVAFHHSYHGKTAGSLSVTWRREFRRFAAIPDDNVLFCRYPTSGGDDSDDCLAELNAAMQEAKENHCPIAAILIEPIQAAEGMMVAGGRFLEGLIRMARDFGALTIYDEIYSGFGRCGTVFYGDRPGLTPDLIAIGKALANGLPISAVIGSPEVMDALPAGNHSSTFAANPLSCAAARAVVRVMQSVQPWNYAQERGETLAAGLNQLAAEYDFLSQPRGEGLMMGFDCLDDEGRCCPARARHFAETLLQHSVIARFGGWSGATIKLTPSLLIDEDEVAFLLGRIRLAAAEMSRVHSDVLR